MNEKDREIFARNLTHYMNRDRVNGVTLAKYMNVSSATISDWMNGKKMPRVDKIKSLSNYFRIDMSDLTDEKGFYKEDPEILRLFNMLDESNQEKLIDRAHELFILQKVDENTVAFKQMLRDERRKKNVGTE